MEIVTALLLFLNGSMIEHVYKADLKTCNESKKMAESVVNSNSVVFVCKKVKAKVTIDEGNQEWSGYHAGLSIGKKTQNLNYELDLRYEDQEGLIDRTIQFTANKQF